MSGASIDLEKFKKLSIEDLEQYQKLLSVEIDDMIRNPYNYFQKYPQYEKLSRELAGYFLLEIIQQENPQVKTAIANGKWSPVKAVVELINDAKGYEERKKKIDDLKEQVENDIMTNLKQMTPEEMQKYVAEHLEIVNEMMEKIRRLDAMKKECGGLVALCPYENSGS